MKVSAKQFEKDGQTEWTKAGVNGAQDQISSAIDVDMTSLNLTSGQINNERLLFWVRGNDVETVKMIVGHTITQIKSGAVLAYREFSKTPFYEGQTSDINPSTQEVLNRFSQVKLCPANKFNELHRQYVVTEEVKEEVTL